MLLLLLLLLLLYISQLDLSQLPASNQRLQQQQQLALLLWSSVHFLNCLNLNVGPGQEERSSFHASSIQSWATGKFICQLITLSASMPSSSRIEGRNCRGYSGATPLRKIDLDCILIRRWVCCTQQQAFLSL